jgi:hypothetical protein
MREGAKRGCPMLASSPYEASAWAPTRERIEWGLKERYRVSKELPPSLLALIQKLDAVEGNLLLRRMHQAPAVRDTLQPSRLG